MLVLAIASTWGFAEASVASVAATLVYNFYFFEPIGTFTIDDPRNWVALFSFLVTAVIASRLSAKAKHRALDAVARQQDLERLYSFSRAILLIDPAEPFLTRLVERILEIFSLNAVVLYDRRTSEYHRAGPAELEGLDEQLRQAALQGTSFSDPARIRSITAVRLGAEPIAAIAMQGKRMPDAVVQGIANLVAIGLERARTQDLAAQVEAARQSEALRTTIIHAMAHEFKTPLTSIIASTTGYFAEPAQNLESKEELVRIADEEAKRLQALIDESLEMARLDSSTIQIQPEPSKMDEIVREVIASLRTDSDGRAIEVVRRGPLFDVAVDRRLMKLAIKQVVDNALKYSSPETPVKVEVLGDNGNVTVAVSDRGKGVSEPEQRRIFERWYRSPSVQRRIPGSGLGLSIALDIVRAHGGDLTVTSQSGETTFRLTLPREGAKK